MEILSAPSHAIQVFNDDVTNLYDSWGSPIIIVSDGPYGVGGFPGDPPTPDNLDIWYEPHIRIWSEKATPQTTLWFWNTDNFGKVCVKTVRISSHKFLYLFLILRFG